MPKLTTSDEILSAFLSVYRAGKARALDGSEAPYNPKREAVLVSHWADTVEFFAEQTGVEGPVGEVPIGGYRKYLDHWARRGAEARGHAPTTANNAVSAIRFVSAVVFGNAPGRDVLRAPVSRDQVPPSFRPGFDLLERDLADDVTPDYQRKRLAGYVTMCTLAALYGAASPDRTPSDLATWRRWAREQGVRVGALSHGVIAIRRLRKLVTEENGWPPLVSASPGKRSVRQIPDLRQKLAARGEHADPRLLRVRAIIEALYPRIGFALTRYLKHLAGRIRTNGYRKRIEMVSRLCFALDALGIDPDADLVDVYKETVLTKAVSPSEDSILNKRGSPGARRRLSVVHAVVEMWGRSSVLSSKLFLMEETGGDLPFYTSMVKSDLGWLYEMNEVAHRFDMITDERVSAHDDWKLVVKTQEAMLQVISAHNHGLIIGGRMNPERLLALISYPQALLMGCLALRRKAEAARLRWVDDGRRLSGRYFSAYCNELWDWMLMTLTLADGLRGANYAGALANKHLLPEWKNGLIVGLSSSFVGINDEEKARTKKTFANETRSRENSRENDIYPALLPPQLVTDFWTLARPRELVAGGVLSTIEDYNRDEDFFAVFPSRGSVDISDSAFSPRPNTRTGRYSSPDALSDRFGQLLHWMIRDILGRKGIPEWDDEAIRDQWRALMKMHRGVRFLIASFWGYEADDWPYAEFITNDMLATLKKHYSAKKGGGASERARLSTGIDAPKHFLQIMRHIRDGGAVDWSRFDPERPDASIVHEGGRRARRVQSS